jgi:hypothetical protein
VLIGGRASQTATGVVRCEVFSASLFRPFPEARAKPEGQDSQETGRGEQRPPCTNPSSRGRPRTSGMG